MVSQNTDHQHRLLRSSVLSAQPWSAVVTLRWGSYFRSTSIGWPWSSVWMQCRMGSKWRWRWDRVETTVKDLAHCVVRIADDGSGCSFETGKVWAGSHRQNKSLVTTFGSRKKMVSDKQTVRNVVEEDVAKLKVWASASKKLAAKLTESNKPLEASYTYGGGIIKDAGVSHAYRKSKIGEGHPRSLPRLRPGYGTSDHCTGWSKSGKNVIALFDNRVC